MIIGTTIDIDGMSCAGCAAAIRMALEDTVGVNKAEVNQVNNQASVLYDPRLISPPEICTAITRLGYQAAVVETA